MLKRAFNTIYSCTIIKIIFAVAVCESYIANAYSADDVDPAAPLPALKKAREVATQSNVNQDSVMDFLGITVNVITAAAGAFGLALAIKAGARLYKNVQDGDQGRYSNGSLVFSLVIGACITISAIIVAIITNFIIK